MQLRHFVWILFFSRKTSDGCHSFAYQFGICWKPTKCQGRAVDTQWLRVMGRSSWGPPVRWCTDGEIGVWWGKRTTPAGEDLIHHQGVSEGFWRRQLHSCTKDLERRKRGHILGRRNTRWEALETVKYSLEKWLPLLPLDEVTAFMFLAVF